MFGYNGRGLLTTYASTGQTKGLTNLRAAGIVGLGMAVPEKVLTNHDLEKLVETSDQWIVDRTGIRERRVAGDGETSGTLGARAGREALASAGIDPLDVDLIVCATTSPDMLFPSTACLIQDALGCTRAAAFDLSAACSGFAYGLAVTSQLVASGAFERVLLIGSDVLTKFTDWTDRGTCILFGDGAGAAVVSTVDPGQGVLGFDLGSDGSGSQMLTIPSSGSLHPQSEQTLKDRLQFIHMDGPAVFRFAVRIMGESAARSVEKCGLTPHDVDWFVPHQANIRIIDSATKRLGIDPERVYVNVERYGNTSAASIPIALYEAYHKGCIKQGDSVVMVGFGAGLTWASCVLVWTMPAVTAVHECSHAAAAGTGSDV